MSSRNDPLPGITERETLRDDPKDKCVGDYTSLEATFKDRDYRCDNDRWDRLSFYAATITAII